MSYISQTGKLSVSKFGNCCFWAFFANLLIPP